MTDTNTPVIPPAEWSAGFDEETRGYLQNKGLNTKKIDEAVVEISKMHRNAEKLLGAPSTELVRFPKDQNSPDWKSVYSRLGVPNDANEYAFKDVKFSDGSELDPGFTDTVRKTASDLHLTKDQAIGVTKTFVEFLDKTDQSELAQRTATIETERSELKKEWGSNHVANMITAKSAAETLGFSKDEINALENSTSYKTVMNMLLKLGKATGEDKFVSSSGSGNKGPMTKEQAIDQKKSLMTDKAWATRYLNGGAEEQKQMRALNRLITGVEAA